MKTALYERHVALGAKVVPFAGWLMPLHYTGAVAESVAVRESVGLFDVSHMGVIAVEGGEAEPFLDYLSTNKIQGQKDGSVVYTVLCNDNGGSVDDVLIYRRDGGHFFLVVNAANRDKVLHHLIYQGGRFDIRIADRFQGYGLLALQGPQATGYCERLFPDIGQLSHMHMQARRLFDRDVLVSKTGYTGELGYEFIGETDAIVAIWDHFIQAGVMPAGLAARDLLRLEMGYALYGHELSDTIAPKESVSFWTVKRSGRRFLGLDAEPHYHRVARGIILLGRGIAREGDRVFFDDEEIGIVTSGNFSPTLKKSIALVMIDQAVDDGARLFVEIRGNRVEAEVVPLPFLQRRQ